VAAAADGVEPREPGRSARQRAAAAALARAALLEVDLGRAADGPAVVAALGARRGARAEVIADATRLLGRALAGAVIGRARRAAWVLRDVPVALPAESAVREDRLDLVWEEAEGLVVARVDTGAPDSRPLSPDALAPARGRPGQEARVVERSGG
jgi:hypothetical protein